jgi:hypothetical protein
MECEHAPDVAGVGVGGGNKSFLRLSSAYGGRRGSGGGKRC